MLLFFVPFAIYMANGRELSSGDTVPTVFVTINLLKQGTIYLDDFHDYVPYNNEPYYVSMQRGHMVSNYPLFPAFMALPIFAPFVWIGMINPGDGDMVWRYLSSMSGACFTAIAVLFMYLTLIHLIDKTGAWLLAMAYGIGTALWPIAGQSLWQHGPSVMWWSIGLYALVKAENHADQVGLWKYLVLAGVSTGAAFHCRNVNAIGLIFIGLAIGWRFRWQGIHYLIPAALLSASLLAYNYWLFGTWNGGYEELLKLQYYLDHITTGRWATPLWVGLAGQLISPSRGILIFSPFLLFSFWGMVVLWRPATSVWKLLAWTIPIPILMLLLFSKYSVWWGGNAHYGPRYQIECYPFLVLYIAVVWERIKAAKPLLILFGVLLAWSVFTQWIGAFCYPSDWAGSPVSLALDKGRLWDWRYNQILSCLKSGIKLPFH
ncbi:MAG: hypothetical protein RBU29_04635 [bacterium]|nr:hypothetical protein [bacterium]